MNNGLELVLDARAMLGEGPCWDDRTGKLYWLDILDKSVHVFTPETGEDIRLDMGQQVGCIGLCESEGAVVGLEDGLYMLDTASGDLSKLVDPEPELPENRCNDGKSDPAGRFWVGSLSMAESDSGPAAVAALYRVEPSGKFEKMRDGITISNGLAWTADNRVMYYIDTPTHKITAFDYDIATGAISNDRTVVTIPESEGSPDGMTIDTEGFLWVGLWAGWKVARYNPQNGKCVETVPVPAANVTCCTFGGAKLDELYITTARITVDEGDERQPHAGGLFCIRTGARGTKTFRFAR